MNRLRVWTLLAATAGVGAAGAAAGGASLERDPARAYLEGEFRIGSSDLRTLERRRAVVRSLPTEDGREVATLGVVHLRVPAGFYVDQLRDIAAFKRTEAVQQIGTFGAPARPEDAHGLTIPDDQLAQLRRCRPQDCGLQLSSEAIERFRTEVDWQDTRAASHANALLRQLLVDMVNEYRTAGAAALMEYNDRRQPLVAAAAFDRMVAEQPVVLQRFPALYRHVLGFPDSPARDVQDVIYWSREKMGPALIISVTHMAHARLSHPAGAFAVASRQLYGSQYFDASLGLTLVVPDGAPDAPNAYVLYVNRSRLDVLGGLLGTVKRPIVRSRTRSAIGDHLVKVRDMVERRFAARQPVSAPADGAPELPGP